MTDTEMGYDEEQLKHRARHAPLEWETARLGRERTVKLYLRDRWHARLIGSLTLSQQEALFNIESAWRVITSGIGMRVFNPMRVDGRRGPEEGLSKEERLLVRYFDWGRAVQEKRLSHAMAIAVIAEGLSLREVDKLYRCRRGTAAGNLKKCLDAYCEVVGWI